MTKEQLDKANQLNSLIGVLETNLSHWSKAKGFGDQIKLKVPLGNGSNALEYITNDFIDFEDLKLAMVHKIEKQLKEAKQELADL